MDAAKVPSDIGPGPARKSKASEVIARLAEIVDGLDAKIKALEAKQASNAEFRRHVFALRAEVGAEAEVLARELGSEMGVTPEEAVTEGLGLLSLVIGEQREGHRLVFLDGDDTIVREIGDLVHPNLVSAATD